MNALAWGVMAYVVAQLIIGLVASRRATDEAGYLLAGRAMGPLLATLSVFATWFGAETCVGAAGEVYAGGLYSATAEPFGYAVCLIILGLFVAAPLWKQEWMTIVDMYKARYTPGVERLAALLLAPTSVIWAAGQIRAFGQVLSATSGMSVAIAVTVAAAVATIYTVFGGLLADAVTDLVQGTVLIAGLVLLTVVVFGELGGVSAAIERVDAARLTFAVPEPVPFWQTMEHWAIPILGSLFSQEVLARMMGSRSAQIARWATLSAAGIYVLVGLLPVTLGLVGPLLIPGLAEPEQILPNLAEQYLHPILYVVFAGALISAILSTVDSALLVAGSLISHNIVVPLRSGGVDERQKVRYARIAVVGCGIAAWYLALGAESVYALVEEASAFGTSGLFLTIAVGMFTRFGGPLSAYTALAAGLIGYVGAGQLGSETPFIVSLGLSAACLLVVGGFETWRERAASA
ncbi:MAG: high affinity choline transporter 1 [Planctomycetota bacterium]|jgi:Na+/proline symporter